MPAFKVQMQQDGASSSTQRGMSLIELLVGVAIAMIATLVVVSAFSMSETHKRNTTGAGDAAQSGNLLSRYLKRTVEEAGSSLTATQQGIFGCNMKIKVAGTVLQPRASAFPAPFANVPQALRAAPFVAISGGTSNRDTLVIMAGRSATSSQDYAASYSAVLSVGKSPAIGFAANDYLLAYEESTGANTLDCYTLRVAANYAPTPLGALIPTLAAKPIGLAKNQVPIDATFNTPPATWQTFLLRNMGQAPSLIALAIDVDDALRGLNLLDPTATAQVIAENVVVLKARYGIDTNNDDVVDAWVDPTGVWAVGSLLDGTEASAAKLRQIQAIRLAYVTRSSQLASGDAENTALTLFPDQSPVTYTMPTVVGRRYQYQAYDLTIPLPNVRALP